MLNRIFRWIKIIIFRPGRLVLIFRACICRLLITLGPPFSGPTFSVTPPLRHAANSVLFLVCMLLLASGVNSRLFFVNHIPISQILIHLLSWLALPFPSTHHLSSTHHFFIPGLKPSFSANPSHRSLPFHPQDWLHGFPGLFTDTSDHIRFIFSFFSLLLLHPFYGLFYRTTWVSRYRGTRKVKPVWI